jgi:hypothetical protein
MLADASAGTNGSYVMARGPHWCWRRERVCLHAFGVTCLLHISIARACQPRSDAVLGPWATKLARHPRHAPRTAGGQAAGVLAPATC